MGAVYGVGAGNMPLGFGHSNGDGEGGMRCRVGSLAEWD